MTVAAKTSSQLSRRERNKQDKLQRIRKAASELFQERGFVGTTTHAIADLADISSGSLFFYARTKEDLLGIVMANDLIETLEGACAAIPRDKPLPEKAMHVFNRLLHYHARQKELSIYFMRECVVMRDARAPSEIQRLTVRVAEVIERIVSQEQQAGTVRPDSSAREIAWCMFDLYLGGLGAFLNESLTLQQSVQSIRRKFRLLFEGITSR